MVKENVSTYIADAEVIDVKAVSLPGNIVVPSRFSVSYDERVDT